MYLVVHSTPGSVSANGGSGANTGHVWITVHSDNGTTVRDAGFGPKDHWGQPGEVYAAGIRSDSWNSSPIAITPQQYAAFSQFADATNNTTLYSPFGGNGYGSANCATWAQQTSLVQRRVPSRMASTE